MSTGEDLFEEIVQEANENMHFSIAQLENMFFESWGQISAEDRLPTRSDDTERFWKGFGKDLASRIIRNRDPALLTIGMIASDVIDAVEKLNVDPGLYKYPIALFVAIVAKTIWDQLEKRDQKNSGN